MELSGQVNVDPATGLVAMRGDFDLANAHELRSCLDTLSPAGRLTIDMGEVTFIDSTALGVLAKFVRAGLTVSVVRASPEATRVLTMAAMGGLLAPEGPAPAN